jgi:uncharacterized membrane protein YhaH (DUF805 family)
MLVPLTLAALFTKLWGDGSAATLFVFGALALTLWVALASLVKRFHDIGWSGLACLMVFIPGVGGFVPLIMLFIPGNDGGNQYGEPCDTLF